MLDANLQLFLSPHYLSVEETQECKKIMEHTDPNLIKKVITLIDRSEFNRHQAAPIIRTQPLSFGRGRQIPIVHKLGFNYSTAAIQMRPFKI